jgi:hypothetical protein
MKQFILSILLLLYFPTLSHDAIHPAFGSWVEYSFFYGAVRTHGINSVEREIKSGKIWYSWKDKRGRLVRREVK